jgi:hypothetical protein
MEQVGCFSVPNPEIDPVAVGASVEHIRFLAMLQHGVRLYGQEEVNNAVFSRARGFDGWTTNSWCLRHAIPSRRGEQEQQGYDNL